LNFETGAAKPMLPVWVQLFSAVDGALSEGAAIAEVVKVPVSKAVLKSA